jgi:hypothetical protein
MTISLACMVGWSMSTRVTTPEVARSRAVDVGWFFCRRSITRRTVHPRAVARERASEILVGVME